MAGAGQVIGLVGLITFVGFLAFVGYQLSKWSSDLGERARQNMEKKNIGFTKDGGLRVGVRDLKTEDYVDRTQNILVNTWNNAAQSHSNSASPSPRPSNSRHSSNAAAAPATNTSETTSRSGRSAGSASLRAPENRSVKRSASPVPGSFD